MAVQTYDFSGWATKNDILCSDGRTIRRDAFKEDNGKTVPLVWMHDHSDPGNVLGHVVLQNRPEGVYAYGKFNDSIAGQQAKECVRNGDLNALSIYANHLKQSNGNVMHGKIREVSLVLAGANDGAMIDNNMIQHGDEWYESEDEFSVQTSIPITGEIDFDPETLEHADDEDEGDNKAEMADTKNTSQEDQSVEEVFDSAMSKLTDTEKNVIYAMLSEALDTNPDDDEDEDDEDEAEDDGEEVEHSDEDDEYYEGEEMKRNVFDGGYNDDTTNYISHADQEAILEDAKRSGNTLQGALRAYAENLGLSHADAADAVAGFDDKTNVQGFDKTSLGLMFPDYREAHGNMPELVTNDQGWITKVLAKVSKAPYTRVRTSQVDIRKAEDLRAKGYKKGNKKALSGNYALIRRTTDPQTVYVRSSLNRDDVVDTTDFDYVQYQYNIDKLQLNEEVATAIMIGDGREDTAADKIFPDKIRPIWTDDELYVKHITVDFEGMKKKLQGTDTAQYFGDEYIYSEAIIDALLHGRETNWFGTGSPDFYCTPNLQNTMLLARDRNGRRIYDNLNDLTTTLNVASMTTAEQFAGKIRTDAQGKKHKLLGIVGNLADYQVGSTKGGEIQHFTDFDIDFNQLKSLLETRLSGAVTRIYSFIVLEEDVADSTATEG